MRASVVVVHGLSCSPAMWDLPGPGLEPVSPALAGGFLNPVPPGKPSHFFFFGECLCVQKLRDNVWAVITMYSHFNRNATTGSLSKKGNLLACIIGKSRDGTGFRHVYGIHVSSSLLLSVLASYCSHAPSSLGEGGTKLPAH